MLSKNHYYKKITKIHKNITSKVSILWTCYLKSRLYKINNYIFNINPSAVINGN